MTPQLSKPETALKPCPFCTCKAVELETCEDSNGNVEYAQVECPACLARGPQEALVESAISFWNEREAPVINTRPKPDDYDGATVSLEVLQKLQRDAGLPNLPTQLTYQARMAMSGEGEFAHEWSDKKHRLTYRLCRHIENAAASLPPQGGSAQSVNSPALREALQWIADSGPHKNVRKPELIERARHALAK